MEQDDRDHGTRPQTIDLRPILNRTHADLFAF
jgi:hypothetical protein